MSDNTGRLELSEEECFRLLEKAPIGRIVYTNRALPAIQPVGFILTERAVVIIADDDTGLTAAIRGTVVAFQADEFDPDGPGPGWSVVAVGRASEVIDSESTDAGDVPLGETPPIRTDPQRYVRVDVEVISGRRITSLPSGRT